MSKENAMIGLMVMIASSMTYDELIEKTEEAIAGYKEAKLLNKPADEIELTLRHIGMTCMMFMHKVSNMEVSEVMNKLDEIDQVRKIIQPQKQ